MNPKCNYPQYEIELPEGIIRQCVDMAPRLLHEAGFFVGNDRFLSALKDKDGIRIDGQRVYFDKRLVNKYVDKYIALQTETVKQSLKKTEPDEKWTVSTAGYSMMTIDVETEQLREATCQDLREMIKLVNSFGVGGSYMVMPQDVPPLMRAIECFKICFEMAENIRPYDWQKREQMPFIYDMCQVVERDFPIVINVTSAFSFDSHELDNFLDYYSIWKGKRNVIFQIADYGMTGVTKPITVPGCAAICFTETLAIQILFNLFDPELETGIAFHGGYPTDMMHACWAFGSPRTHLFQFLNSMLLPNLCKVMRSTYTVNDAVMLATSSPAIDEQAALEKTAIGLLGAMQGSRHFHYAGVLCADDVYSGTQFVIDLEIVDYIRETIEAFTPHPDIIDIEGLYEECLDVALGKDTFISSFNTAKRCRNIIPSSNLIVREKLRSWMSHSKLLKDRAREVATEHIRNFEPFHLPVDKQRELDKIYERARAVFA